MTNNSNNGEVRAWTRDLTDRFGPEGDKVVADTFMDMPYMNHHVFFPKVSHPQSFCESFETLVAQTSLHCVLPSGSA